MKNYSVNDGPKFKNKKTLQKWVNLHISMESVKDGLVYSDGTIQVYITDTKVLSALLSSEDEND
jgi:hypothetical protein